MGIGKDGKPTANFQRGVELHGTLTIFAEGCRGSLARGLFERFNLAANSDPQTYGIGLKELWEVAPEKHRRGRVTHTVGWPLDNKTYGGSFIYHLENNQVAIGFVVGLDYANPYLSPYEEFQRFKTHPKVAPLLEGGRRIAYGARALNEGGFQSIPALTVPGAALIGASAGFMNVPKVKETHLAMKSAMLAAESAFEAIASGDRKMLDDYPKRVRASWIWPELKGVRNIRPGFHLGLWAGLVHAAIDTYLFRGRAPWTLRHNPDHKSLVPARSAHRIEYPKSDGKLTFDRLSSVFVSNTNHEENQPPHLKLKDPHKAIGVNFQQYASPEQRYCPAGVYEIVYGGRGGEPKLQINAQNCLHCKTCDIKDPTQNIVFTVPEGGGGPNYPNM
jgi:electron-transferring-flavoprotein dehydrogenase